MAALARRQRRRRADRLTICGTLTQPAFATLDDFPKNVHPNCPLDEQDAENVLWKIYPDDDDLGHGQRHIVHGHHQHAHGPIFKKNRTNLDTLAWYTGRLAIGVFDDAAPGGPTEVLEVRGEPLEKILSSRRSRSPLATNSGEAAHA